jgi:hypothetical protein
VIAMHSMMVGETALWSCFLLAFGLVEGLPCSELDPAHPETSAPQESKLGRLVI